METKNIEKHIDIINDLLEWRERYAKGTFSVSDLHKERRRLKMIRKSAEGKCCAAAYGISQVGKSYLMSSLLSTENKSFNVSIGGEESDFITKLNPSGSKTGKSESTGIITRFTTDADSETKGGLVKITMLSAIDIVLMLADAYYNDVEQDIDSVYTTTEIDRRVDGLTEYWSNHTYQHSYIEEDDIKEVLDYFKDVLKVRDVVSSKFFDVVAPNIKYVKPENWRHVFGLLWDNNKDISYLFHHLIEELEKLGFIENAYIPVSALLSINGSLLDITLLDKVCGKENSIKYNIEDTDVYSSNSKIIATGFSKYYLAALTAEVTFELPKSLETENDKEFLKYLDLLDFPGARSRKQFPVESIDSDALAEILRRGKVAYLFNKYSRSLKIGTVLFCHDDDQSEVSPISGSIDGWIKEYISKTSSGRTEVLKLTDCISPLFFICTKFNKELKATDADCPETLEFLDNHWNRFNQVIPGVVQPGRWLEDWVEAGSVFRSQYFQSIYLLRDYSYSTDFFEGYDKYKGAPELRFKNPSNFPNYYDELRASFLRNEFVRRHFANPEQSWDDVATANHDGSAAIIRDLNKIAKLVEKAREDKYLIELREMRQRLLSVLEANYILDTDDGRSEKLRRVVTSLQFKLDRIIGKSPEKFGRIIDDMMVKPREIYNLAYNIVVLRREVPKSFSEIGFIRQRAGIKASDDYVARIDKLCKSYQVSAVELEEILREDGYTLDDVVSTEIENESTQASLIIKNVLAFWAEHINAAMQNYSSLFPYTDEFANMLINNIKSLGISERLVEKVQYYQEHFEQDACINAIADYVSLTLNNYVSTIGNESYNDEALSLIEQKAKTCNFNISLEEAVQGGHSFSLEEALQALEESKNIQLGRCSVETLNRLPFWANYQRWLKHLVAGFVYAENIIVCDKESNDKIKVLIDECKELY